jgi:hypothetical protein
MGALVTAIGKSKIDSGLPHLAAGTRSAIANRLGAGVTLIGACVAFVFVKHGASQAPAAEPATTDPKRGIPAEAAEAELTLV